MSGNEISFDLGMQIPRIIWTIDSFPTLRTSITTAAFATDQKLMSLTNFAQLVRQNAADMQAVVIRPRFQLNIPILKTRLQRFLEYSFPKVRSATIHGDVVDAPSLKRIFQKCPKLCRVDFIKFTAEISPIGLECRSLEKISADCCSVASMWSIIRKSIKLNHFDLKDLAPGNDFYEMMTVLRNEKPNIEVLRLRIPSFPRDQESWLDLIIREQEFDVVCRFRMIRELAIDSDSAVSSQQIHRLLNSMPYLESLSLNVASVDRDGLMELAKFRWLRKIWIKIVRKLAEFDEGMREILRMRPRWEDIRIDYEVDAAVMVEAVNNCRFLKSLRLFKVKGINSAEEAGTLARSFDGFAQRHLRIEIDFGLESIWRSDRVRNEMAMLNKGVTDQAIEFTLHTPLAEMSEWIETGPPIGPGIGAGIGGGGGVANWWPCDIL